MMLNQVMGRTGASTTPRDDPPRTSISMLQRRMRWRRWRVNRSPEPEVLSSAELSECCCPDICHRDHEND
jgi:hypothetical protein